MINETQKSQEEIKSLLNSNIDKKDEIAEDISFQIIDIVNVFNLFENKDNDSSIEVQGSLQSIIMELLKNIPLEKIESIKKYSKKELDYVNSIKK